MSFKKDKYCVIKNAISNEVAQFIFNYFLMKRQVLQTMVSRNMISPFDRTWGQLQDDQVPDTFAHYADVAMETLLLKLLPEMEKHTEEKLIPTYSYARIYKKGDVLERHKDRESCEISTTLFLGGDKWPIYLSPYENVGKTKDGFKYASEAKGKSINLEQGDMLVYSGCELEHWREKFDGQDCAQVFLHYNRDTKENQNRLYDCRPHVGLPAIFKEDLYPNK